MKSGKTILLCMALLPLLAASSCQSPTKTARDSIAAANGAIAQAQIQFKAQCTAAPTGDACSAINRAIASENLAIDALEAYCGISASAPDTQTCVEKPEALPALQSALSNLSDVTVQVKALVKK